MRWRYPKRPGLLRFDKVVEYGGDWRMGASWSVLARVRKRCCQGRIQWIPGLLKTHPIKMATATAVRGELKWRPPPGPEFQFVVSMDATSI